MVYRRRGSIVWLLFCGFDRVVCGLEFYIIIFYFGIIAFKKVVGGSFFRSLFFFIKGFLRGTFWSVWDGGRVVCLILRRYFRFILKFSLWRLGWFVLNFI